MKTRKYEVKSIDEVLPIAVKELRIAEEELEVTILKERKGFLGIGAKLEVEVKPKVDGIEKGKNYIQNILETNQVEGFIEMRVRDDVVEFNVEAGKFNGVLIGKNARHLIALQMLVNMIINSYYDEDEQKIVKVDVGGYRKRRDRKLERMAVDLGKQVAKSKHPVKLDNLNSYERKIIHDKLSSWKDVKTRSAGEEPDRNLIIEPK